MDEKNALVSYLDYLIGAAVGGVGSSLLTITAMWRRFITRKDHDRMCGLEGAITRAEFIAASALQDEKLQRINDKVEGVEKRIVETRNDLSAQVTQSKRDLSGKLNTVVALLTGKQIDNGA